MAVPLTPLYPADKELSDCIREIHKYGKRNLFYKGMLVWFHYQYPNAWANDAGTILDVLALYGFTMSDIGNGQFKLYVYPAV